MAEARLLEVGDDHPCAQMPCEIREARAENVRCVRDLDGKTYYEWWIEPTRMVRYDADLLDGVLDRLRSNPIDLSKDS